MFNPQYPIVTEVPHMSSNDGDTFGFTLEDEERIQREAERAELQRVAARPYRHIRMTPAS